MADFQSINNIYNYYLTTYAPKTDSKFDTHKKSELRSVYNSIVKMNTDSPLVIIDKSQETKEYAVGLKENARSLHNTIASLGGTVDEDMLNNKVAYSSNEDLASARFIGQDTDTDVPTIDLYVEKLATSQVNEGKLLQPDIKDLPEGTYSFDVGINGLNYEFQYKVNEDDTNKSIQEKLSRLISNAGIGLKGSVEDDGNGSTRLIVESEYTGDKTGNKDHLFNITDDNTSQTRGSVDYFGLNNVVQESSNSRFYVNGQEAEATSNTFTVDKKYEITMNRVSENSDDTTHIDIKTDVDSIAENLNVLIDGYNNFIDTAEGYSDTHPKSTRLVNEMSAIASFHTEELSAVGMTLESDGHISLDKNALAEAAADGNIADNLDDLKHFAGSLLRKTDEVSLNPMKYADKTIVAYKNPLGQKYASPYVTSAYSGMMFNSYC